MDETPDDKAQMSFTDPELGIMQTNNKGWDSCGKAQASADGADQIMGACDVTAEAHDKQQAAPMAQLTVPQLEQAGIAIPTDAPGATQKMPATYASGYYSEAAAAAVEQWGFEPYMATGRQRPHVLAPQVTETPTTAKERMAAKVRTPGRACGVRQTQSHCGARVWPEQRSAWVPSLPGARVGQNPWRMAARVSAP